ncbi:MAG: ketoacyl-ACP synthase III [Chitinispirillia bacterium]|nr:ketoacyl-ACP synthase III [Chitinispirillia bacterium]MCL2269046.1 ketoacyl-ACP synthase III [Chitinispirillia bacterium]
MSDIRARILSVGTYVPEKVLTNAYFESILDTSDEWIMTRTGIRERRVVDRDNPMSAAEMGCRAARAAMERANVSADSIDGIIVATFTPDNFFPSTACRMQADLGCRDAFAFDMSAACAGFVYALTVANNMIVSGQAKTILVVGSEVISKTLDWSDRGTCILFGDGAGVVVLQADGVKSKGIQSCYLSSDGSMGDILKLPAWGSERYLSMKGSEVFKHAVRMMSDASVKAAKRAGLSIGDIDLLIPHQANIRIIQSIADMLSVPMDKVVTNLDRYGNTSSASIPLALEEAWTAGRVRDGSKVLFVGLGGGFTVGSAVCII